MTLLTEKQLFQEFPPVGWDEWKAQASVDLRQTPFERIRWTTPDGFTIEPWYAPGNTAALSERSNPEQGNSWRNCRRIAVSDIHQANRSALESFSQDVTALEFFFCNQDLCTGENITLLLQGISVPAVAIYFSGLLGNPLLLMETLAAMPEFSGNTGGILASLAQVPEGQERALCNAARSMPDFRFLPVDTVPWHDQGATASQEIALALAAASDTIHRFTEAGIEADIVVAGMEVIMAAGSSHFTELAKPRALRALLPPLLKAWGARKNTMPRLFARTSAANRSTLDPFTNVLRQTTEAVSAVLGGYRTLQIDPFDNGLSVPENTAERISANIHLILREESFLHRVADPAAGSHYIETLGAELAKSAWSFFLEIEATGGLAVALQNGTVTRAIAGSGAARKKALETRKKTLIGVNRYPWPLTPVQERNIDELLHVVETKPSGSHTAAFERLRLKAERHRSLTGRVPTVFIGLSGDPAISFRQAAFAEDFFRCGGFDIAGTAMLEGEEDACDKALIDSPAIAVLCVAEKDPVPQAEALCRALSDRHPSLITVLAGKPPDNPEKLFNAGLDSFIYTGVDVLAMLQSYHTKTGIQ